MTDFSKIKKSLLSLYPFTEEQLSHFADRLAPRELKKKEFLLQEHQISHSISFINTGSLRLFNTIDEKELTLNFFTENQWVADVESLLTQQPSKNYIEAFENSNVSSITLQDIHYLMDIHPCFRMLNTLLTDLTISTTKIASLITKNPDERYATLLLQYPNWINRFPQMQIASYLGMTPETLSRVRARLA